MAEMLGITRQAYGHYESGKREPDFVTLEKLATFFNVSTDYLLGRVDNPDPSIISPVAEVVTGYTKIQTQDIPADITEFAIDPKNQTLIRKIQGMLKSGYSIDAVHEWLDSFEQNAKQIEKAILEKYSLKELQEKGAWLDHDPTPDEQELLNKFMKRHKEGKAFPFQTEK